MDIRKRNIIYLMQNIPNKVEFKLLITGVKRRRKKKEMFYLTMHSTHFIYGYMASDMVKDDSDSKRGNPLPPQRLLFPISCKGSFICIIPQTG